MSYQLVIAVQVPKRDGRHKIGEEDLEEAVGGLGWYRSKERL